jgi:hypothetical protein
MARDLRRRLDRLERQGQPPGALVREWLEWLQHWESILQRAYPDCNLRSDAELLAQAEVEATTGRTPVQAWTEALIAVWQERQVKQENKLHGGVTASTGDSPPCKPRDKSSSRPRCSQRKRPPPHRQGRAMRGMV